MGKLKKRRRRERRGRKRRKGWRSKREKERGVIKEEGEKKEKYIHICICVRVCVCVCILLPFTKFFFFLKNTDNKDYSFPSKVLWTIKFEKFRIIYLRLHAKFVIMNLILLHSVYNYVFFFFSFLSFNQLTVSVLGISVCFTLSHHRLRSQTIFDFPYSYNRHGIVFHI